ncbi:MULTISPECIES: serine hydrolase [unclassified Streptomyces]|uniref:serine hydrolase n=1 Tax=unclassified Streptomyces TaxID=2593676 RepID=UPI003824027D
MQRTRISRRARRGLAALAAAGVAAGVALTTLGSAEPAAASTASAPVDGSKVVCTSKKPGLAPHLSRDLASALDGREGSSALAVYDRRTHTHCTFRADARFDSASVVKVTVLGALLRQAEEAHRKLTPKEVRLTTDMITKSDNDATSALWKQIGPAGIKHFLALAKMTDTTPGAAGAWGLTQVTAGDQLTLMQLLTTKNAVLTKADRGYALGLMRHVEPDQRWGAPAGAPATAVTHVKDGWLPRASDGWRVHSVGSFTGHGNDYGMAVLSRGNDTMDYGVDTVENAARVIHHDLAGTGSTGR